MGTKESDVGLLVLIPFQVYMNKGAGNISSVNMFSNVSKSCIIHSKGSFILFFVEEKQSKSGTAGITEILRPSTIRIQNNFWIRRDLV